MDMLYSISVDSVAREILIKSLNAQLKTFQDKLLLGDETPETKQMYERIDQLIRIILYTKALKKEGLDPSHELPNWLSVRTFSLNELLTDCLDGTIGGINNEEVVASGLSVRSCRTNELVDIVSVIGAEFTSSLKSL